MGGVVGGLALWMEPSGAWLGMDRSLLAASPFADFEIPGLVLLLANGVLPLGAALAVWARSPRAPWWVAASGLVLVGWIAVQLMWVGFAMWLQPFLLSWGVALLALGSIWIAIGPTERQGRAA